MESGRLYCALSLVGVTKLSLAAPMQRSVIAAATTRMIANSNRRRSIVGQGFIENSLGRFLSYSPMLCLELPLSG